MCDEGVVRGETEQFFAEWMRAKAAPWGSLEERQASKFPERPRGHRDIPEFGDVSDTVEEILCRAAKDGGALQGLHKGTDRIIELAELKEYLGGAKKNTAPGVSGVAIEMWVTARREPYWLS